MIDQATKLNAVIGYPLEHTLSPVLHTKIYQDNNINAILLAFANQDVQALVKTIRTLPINLTAVTMPHKLEVIKYIDEVDAVAKKIKAVNTVINRQGKLYGYNTDILGVARSLQGVKIKNKKVLLIGAGGAARTVACYLQQVGGLPLYLNRTRKEADNLANEFGGQVVELKDLVSQEIAVIVNATPVGMYPKIDRMPIPEELLSSQQIVMDVIYNPIETKLLKIAQAKGAKTVSGLQMFVGQALEQIKLWQNQDIKDKDYFNFLSKQIINN